jgi:hypothetical protein
MHGMKSTIKAVLKIKAMSEEDATTLLVQNVHRASNITLQGALTILASLLRPKIVVEMAEKILFNRHLISKTAFLRGPVSEAQVTNLIHEEEFYGNPLLLMLLMVYLNARGWDSPVLQNPQLRPALMLLHQEIGPERWASLGLNAPVWMN